MVKDESDDNNVVEENFGGTGEREKKGYVLVRILNLPTKIYCIMNKPQH